LSVTLIDFYKLDYYTKESITAVKSFMIQIMVPAAGAGLKPLTLGGRGECSTTAQIPTVICKYQPGESITAKKGLY